MSSGRLWVLPSATLMRTRPPIPRLLARAALRLVPAAVGLGACTGTGGGGPTRVHPVAAGDTLYIGVTTASAGSRADTSVLGGIALAVERLNAERPAGAAPLGVRIPALGSQSQVTVAAALRDDPRVAVVLGGAGSSAMLDAAPVFADVEHDGARAVAVLTPLATNPAIAHSSAWVFRVCPSDDDAAAALAHFAAESLGVRRVAVVFSNDLFGRGFTRRVVPELAARGVRVTERDPHLAGVTRYEAYAARIARGGADALLVAGTAADAAAVVHAVRDAGARPAVLGTDDVAAVAGALAADPVMRGARFVTFLDPRIATGAAADPHAAPFLAAYRVRFGRTPDHRAALSYDATLLAGRTVLAQAPRPTARAVGGALAVIRAGLRTGAASAGAGDVYALRRRVRDALARVGREDPPFVGVSGAVRFDADGGAEGRPVWIGRVGS